MMDFWEQTVRFFSLTDANVRYVVAGAMLLGGATGGLGSFAFLQKRSLLGDAVSHAALPGVGLAFLLTGQKDLLILLLGAISTAWLGTVIINAIVQHTKIKIDAAMGIVLTVFFGLGVVLLTHIQKTGSGAQSGLDKFLFGQAAALSKQDVWVLAVVSGVLLVTIVAGFNRFKIITFDADFARASGLRVGWLQFILTSMIVLAVTIGLQAVGVVLMAAMLVTPVAAARQWTDRLGLIIILASLFGILSGVFGAYVSFLAPRFPTGPWMVVVVSVIFAVSILFSPHRGVISHLRQHMTNRRKMTREHVLKVLFKAGQEQQRWDSYFPFSQILRMWSFQPSELRRALKKLRQQKLIEQSGDMYRLTENGIREGARIIRLHRLWEVYLSRYLDLPDDHVHRDAEDMEHVLTPEMEQKLLELLEHPDQDPHRQEIPYLGLEERK